MTEADTIREFIKPSLTTTVVGNGVIGVAWAALFAAVTFGVEMGENRADVATMIVGLAFLRILPPYLLAAIGYASVVRADRLAVASLVLAPLSGLLASFLGASMTWYLPLLELPMHLLTTITAVSTARTLMASTPDELADLVDKAAA